jgi:hypothetical protein
VRSTQADRLTGVSRKSGLASPCRGFRKSAPVVTGYAASAAVGHGIVVNGDDCCVDLLVGCTVWETGCGFCLCFGLCHLSGGNRSQ